MVRRLISALRFILRLMTARTMRVYDAVLAVGIASFWFGNITAGVILIITVIAIVVLAQFLGEYRP